MRSEVADRIMAKMPEDVKIFTDKYADLVVLINQILHEKGYTQKSLADSLEKRPSEIHKWLNGDHNFTLRSIAKLEAELGETLLGVPSRKATKENYTHYSKTVYTLTVFKNLTTSKEKIENWKKAITQPEYSNVG